MIDHGHEPLDEMTLRRALRLEADERAPRFDAADIAAAARERPRRAMLSALVAALVGAASAAAAWSAAAIFVPTVAAAALDLALGLLALLAVPASRLAELVQQPVIPLSLVVALAIATMHELRERLVHVDAS